MILYYYVLIVSMVFHELGHYIAARRYDKTIRIMFQYSDKNKFLGTEIPDCLTTDQYKNILVCGILLGYVVLLFGILSIPNFNFYIVFLMSLVYLVLCNKDLKGLFK